MQQDFFHSNLRRARESAGISQAGLADACVEALEGFDPTLYEE